MNRLLNVFSTRYADKLELYSFTDEQIALQTVQKARIDVLLASDLFSINVSSLPKRCAFAYFVEINDLDSVNGEKAICKFQKAEQIYKQILSLYAEKADNIAGVRLGGDNSNLIAFISAGGGVGSSTMAAACAVRFTSQGQKILYLNLEQLGGAEPFFTAEGAFTLFDVIFALKSKKANIQMKLESNVRKDSRGVCFFANAPQALDLVEFGSDEVIQLITELRLAGTYDVIILDMDFSLKVDCLKVLQEANAIVMVSDGSEVCNMKTYRAYSALEILDQGRDSRILDRMVLAYNRFSNKTSKTVAGVELKEIGGAPVYQHASTQDVIKALSERDLFDNIM